MVAANPLFAGGSYYKKFKATVINDIWPEVLFFAAIATSESYPLLPPTRRDSSADSGHRGLGEDPTFARDI